MPSPNERKRNNIRTGAFVSISIALAIAVIVLVSGVWESLFTSSNRYTVAFTVESGVNNLQAGAEVRVGGVKMGKVEDVRPSVVDGESFREILVDFEIRADIPLFSDAAVHITSPLLGTDAWLDIPKVGTSMNPLQAGDVIRGQEGTGLLSTMLGPEKAQATGEIIDNAKAFTGFLTDEIYADYQEHVRPTMENMRATSEKIDDLVTTVRDENWPTWSAAVDDVMSWTSGFTADLTAAVDAGEAMFADGRTVIADNRQDLRDGVENFKAVTVRAREETMAKVDRLLATGQEGLDSAVATIERIQTDYVTWETDFSETLGNANLASQQLKLTTTEVRRSPWKVLYRPSVDELEHEMLYDAARSFAVAATDLKAAAVSVDRILAEHGDRLREDPDLFERVTRNLRDPLERYEVAQQRLFDVLLVDGP